MLRGLIAILFFQCAGELLARWLSTPVPGPVIGMLLLLATLLLTGKCPDDLERVGDALLQHLGLLFVPAAVGVLVYASQLRIHGVALLLLLLVSTGVTVVVSGLAAKYFSRRPDDNTRTSSYNDGTGGDSAMNCSDNTGTGSVNTRLDSDPTRTGRNHG